MKVVWSLLKETVTEWLADKAPRLGAALAYYSVFSIAPLCVIAIAVAGLVFGEQAARGQIVLQLRQALGEPTAQALEAMILNASNPASSKLATIVGAVTLVVGASGVFAQLKDALNTIWKVKPKPGYGVVAFLWNQFLAFVMVLLIGAVLLVLLLTTAALEAVNAHLPAERLPGGASLWQTINLIVSLGIVTLLLALTFKVLPDVTLAWKDVWLGASVTGVLFTAGKLLIGFYLAHAQLLSAYGAVGSIVVLLVWVYYSSQIVLLGAEFTRVYTHHFGVQIAPAWNAVSVTPVERAHQGMS